MTAKTWQDSKGMKNRYFVPADPSPRKVAARNSTGDTPKDQFRGGCALAFAQALGST
jgi:hypothetical protein